MWYPQLSFAALAVPALVSATTTNSSLGPDQDGKYTIQSDHLRLQFIPYGAAITNLFIESKGGEELDIILGWDNATFYQTSKEHPFFGGIVGRYANRIKNSTFTINTLNGTEQTYKVLANDNPTPEYPDGVDTLHGGPNGTDRRDWTIVAHTKDTITFSLLDKNGEQGFPGDISSYVTYTVKGWEWDIRIAAVATTKYTPIMLTSHGYWNLDGFKNPETALANNHTLHMPYAGQRIGTDSILIPNGNILANEKGGVHDFWSAPKQLGSSLDDPSLLGACGFNCSGYDTCYINSLREQPPILPRSNWLKDPVASVASNYSGIQLDIYTNQDAFQVYSCPGQDGTLPLKKTQGLPGRNNVVEKYGCAVFEVEDWIDGINHPEWGRTDHQVYGPDTGAYELGAKYVFSVKE